nr:diguanylate cyclase [Micromonospora sp. DSM 115978]
MLLAARLTARPGHFIVFQQPEAAFYASVREGQPALNLVLAAMVLIAVGGVAWSNDRREASVRRGKQRLDALLHSTHDVIVRTARDGRITFVSSAAQRLLGVRFADLAGRRLEDLAHVDDAPKLRNCLAQPVTSELDDVRLRRADGAYLWFGVLSSPLPGAGGGTKVVTCHEIGARKRLQDQLSYQADHDSLTGLCNRNVFYRRIEEVTRRAGAETHEKAARGDSACRGDVQRDGRFAVLFVDLDHFKPVNDTYGHEAGDQVLRVVGARLQGTVRDRDLVCRFGGDEFA